MKKLRKKEYMNFFGRFKGHLKTITTHKGKVFVHCVKAGIIWQGLVHDLSKFSPAEFIPGVRFYQGYRSPNESERELYGYSKAWLHHKGRNRHHYEYWTDYNPADKKILPVKMPVKYVMEMFCDRVAASKTYKKDEYNDACPLEYYLGRKEHKDILQDDTERLIRFLLTMLKEKGEEKTFAYIRNFRKKHKGTDY